MATAVGSATYTVLGRNSVSGTKTYTVTAPTGNSVSGSKTYTVLAAGTNSISGSATYTVTSAGAFYMCAGTTLMPIKLAKRNGTTLDVLTN